MSPAVVVRHLKNPSDDELHRATMVAAAAFANDKFALSLAGNDRSLIYQTVIKAAAVGGELYVAGFGADDILGVACWFGPGQELFGTEEQRNAGYYDYLKMVPDELRTWWTEYLIPLLAKFTEETVGLDYKKNSWSLHNLCVLPEHQGKGLSKAMIQTIETIAALDGTPLVLETNNERNIIIYKRLGFKLHEQTIQIKGGGGEVTTYIMTKETGDASLAGH